MYVLAKSVLALMIGFIASVVLGLVFIPWLRKLKVGQKTSVFVKAHEKKSGTPTMGGIIFIVSTIFTILFLCFTNKLKISSNLLIILFVFFGYGLIGFVDDFLKAELALCRMMQEINALIVDGLNFE